MSYNKIPEVTLAFWIMKICATTLGETGGDLLSMTLNIGYAASTLILIVVFLATLAMQLMAIRYHPFLFWTVILSTSTAGTTLSDYMDRTLGLGYTAGSMILISILALTLVIWRQVEGTIAIKSIKTRRAEVFYWLAILFSNTLGTALGDFLADSSGLGFGGGALLIGSLIALIIAAHFFTSISQTILFWSAFVLTRPLGATLGDLLTKPHERGGLDFGTIGSSEVLGIALMILIFMEYKARHNCDKLGMLTQRK